MKYVVALVAVVGLLVVADRKMKKDMDEYNEKIVRLYE